LKAGGFFYFEQKPVSQKLVENYLNQEKKSKLKLAKSGIMMYI